VSAVYEARVRLIGLIAVFSFETMAASARALALGFLGLGNFGSVKCGEASLGRSGST